MSLTTDGAGGLIRTFLDYHFSLGISHAFLFFERPDDSAIPIAKTYRNVTVFEPGQTLNDLRSKQVLFKSLQPHLGHELIARQMLNLETAIDCANQMDLDWLIHIDDDELLFAPGGLPEFFGALGDDVGQVTFLNHEAVPETWVIDNYFIEVTLFKVNPAFEALRLAKEAGIPVPLFNGYSNGKSAVRIEGDVLPLGPHSFLVSKRHPTSIVAGPEAAIYHYINCGFARFVRKYERLGKFSDYYFGKPDPNLLFGWEGNQRITLSFHMAARDALFNQGLPEMEKLYRRQVQILDPATQADLIAQGFLIRNVAIRERLERVGSRVEPFG